VPELKLVPVGFTRSASDPSGGSIEATDLTPYIRVGHKVWDAVSLAERISTVLPTIPQPC